VVGKDSRTTQDGEPSPVEGMLPRSCAGRLGSGE